MSDMPTSTGAIAYTESNVRKKQDGNYTYTFSRKMAFIEASHNMSTTRIPKTCCGSIDHLFFFTRSGWNRVKYNLVAMYDAFKCYRIVVKCLSADSRNEAIV